MARFIPDIGSSICRTDHNLGTSLVDEPPEPATLAMTGNAHRIRKLRERTGKSSDEIATLAGLGDMEYFDLEFHDDELLTVPSLEKIKCLAGVLGVRTPALFLDEPASVRHHTSYAELVARVRSELATGINKEAFEDEIGWDLDDFLKSEEKALSAYGVEFLQALCGRLGIPWIEALP